MKSFSTTLLILACTVFSDFAEAGQSASRIAGRVGAVLSTQRSDLSDEEYQVIRQIALTIIQRYSPTEAAYLGVGRSPAPVMRFLHELGLRNHGSLPISKLRVVTVSHAPELENLREKFFHYFDYAFYGPGPLHELVTYRKLVLIDYMDSGGALKVMCGWWIQIKTPLMYFSGRKKAGFC